MGIKISNLPPIVTPDLTDIFPVVQDGVTFQETITQLGTLFESLFATAGANSNITSLSGLTTPLSVDQGGTGRASSTAFAVICGGTTSTAAQQSIASVGTTGQVLTSNGAAALPSFQDGGNSITAWTPYTPTFTGFGIATGIEIWSRRDGDDLQVRGRFTSGTATGVEGRMTLGFNGTDSNVTSSSVNITSIQMAGAAIVDFNLAASFTTLIESNVKYITFGAQGSGNSGLTKLTGAALLGTGGTISFISSIPVDTFP